MRTLYAVVNCDELAPGDRLRAEVNGVDLVIANVDGHFHAFAHACPHQGGPIGDGEIEGWQITCPAHRWRYDIRSGRSLGPERSRLRTFPIKVLNHEVLVEVPSSESPRDEH